MKLYPLVMMVWSDAIQKPSLCSLGATASDHGSDTALHAPTKQWSSTSGNAEVRITEEKRTLSLDGRQHLATRSANRREHRNLYILQLSETLC